MSSISHVLVYCTCVCVPKLFFYIVCNEMKKTCSFTLLSRLFHFERKLLVFRFDAGSHTAFVGDFTGVVHMLRLHNNRLETKNTLRGHDGSVRALAWDSRGSMLFSASYDRTVIVWDLGGGRGVAYELQVSAPLLLSYSGELSCCVGSHLQAEKR